MLGKCHDGVVQVDPLLLIRRSTLFRSDTTFRDCAALSLCAALAIILPYTKNMDVSDCVCEKASLSRRSARPWMHSMLVKPHTAHAISQPRAALINIDTRLSWLGRKPCNGIRMFRSTRLRAQQDQGSLGPDESQSFSNVELSDEELYRQVIEELPTELADDIDPEGKELTLEDLMTAQGGIPASLRSELLSDDVWGPPVSPSPYPSCCVLLIRDQMSYTLAVDDATMHCAMTKSSSFTQCAASYALKSFLTVYRLWCWLASEPRSRQW